MGEVATPAWAQVGYLVVAVCLVLALKGLSSPRTARVGNLLGAAGALLALVLVFVTARPDNLPAILGALGVGGLVGVVAARKVAMTAVPQLVAVFTGAGGAAAALVALTAVTTPGVAALAIVAGAVSVAGSAVTVAKLRDLLPARPIVVPQARWVYPGVLLVTLAAAITLAVTGATVAGVALALLGLAVGVLLVLPVGGSDVPVAIAVLNASTGVAVAASGYLLGNVLLLVAGTLVGAAGALLTRVMARTMSRRLSSILMGALVGPSTLGQAQESTRPVRSVGPEDVAALLGYASRVVLVPGFGLAAAQAQHVLRDLADVLASRGVEVLYAIHPVAGRMPGHMNVLLAEADVPYDQLADLDRANPELRAADVAVVVGANDVVNPAARQPYGSPLAGMAILDVDRAASVVVLKRSRRPGYAGVENELLYHPKTSVLFGDAKESLTRLVAAVRSL
jgi:NAD(P) transhydrogenase subunit beta